MHEKYGGTRNVIKEKKHECKTGLRKQHPILNTVRRVGKTKGVLKQDFEDSRGVK
jgi:hypothetical protein